MAPGLVIRRIPTERFFILTGVGAGLPDGEGRYPPDSGYGRIQEKLSRYLARAQALKKAAAV